ncbi:hypothetical protein HGRIS_001957 [Hohenbuehelia grisea]|uniref:Uncharacterized protein n=1 Tax=Hohenbuehelia grisea TaxID=104357 RepID=A0ABR3JJ41_9AGAR
MITPKEALIVSIFFMSFLQGVFTMLLGAIIYLVCIKKKHTKGINARYGLFAIVAMFVVSTTHFVMVFYQDYTNFGGSVDEATQDIKVFARFGLAQIAIEFLNCIMADMLLVWRAWHIYNKDWRIIALPCCCVVGLIITSYGYIGSSYAALGSLEGNDIQAVFAQAAVAPIHTWQVIGISLSVTTNVSLTGLIAAKLLRHQRSMRKLNGFSTLVFESLVIIESGALYALAWIVYLVLFVMHHNAEVIALDIISQLAGIVPALIIVTISAGLSPVHSVPLHRNSVRVRRDAREKASFDDDEPPAVESVMRFNVPAQNYSVSYTAEDPSQITDDTAFESKGSSKERVCAAV